MELTFFLYFRKESRAHKAAEVLRRRRFAVEVAPPEGQVDVWSVEAAADLPPNVISPRFALIEWRLRWLALRLGGEYDGHAADLRDL